MKNVSFWIDNAPTQKFPRLQRNINVHVIVVGAGTTAAYLDDEDNICKPSPVCTHLACLVTWNPAESTWVSPCYGSRSKPTREITAAPTQQSLTPISTLTITVRISN